MAKKVSGTGSDEPKRDRIDYLPRAEPTVRDRQGQDNNLAKPTPNIRPAAGGHRFGPNLECSECGRSWDDHQNDPSPCADKPPAAVVTATAKLDPVAIASPADDRKD